MEAEHSRHVAEVAADVADSFFRLAALDRRIAIARETSQRLADAVAAARERYRVGKGAQADVLRADLERTALEDRLASLSGERRSEAARFNSLQDLPRGLRGRPHGRRVGEDLRARGSPPSRYRRPRSSSRHGGAGEPLAWPRGRRRCGAERLGWKGRASNAGPTGCSRATTAGGKVRGHGRSLGLLQPSVGASAEARREAGARGRRSFRARGPASRPCATRCGATSSRPGRTWRETGTRPASTASRSFPRRRSTIAPRGRRTRSARSIS